MLLDRPIINDTNENEWTKSGPALQVLKSELQKFIIYFTLFCHPKRIYVCIYFIALSLILVPSPPFWLQAAWGTRSLCSPPMCMCQTTEATPGCWPSGAPTTMPSWTLGACWWPWNTPISQSARSSERDLLFCQLQINRKSAVFHLSNVQCTAAGT